jgi:hypothetical protein
MSIHKQYNQKHHNPRIQGLEKNLSFEHNLDYTIHQERGKGNKEKDGPRMHPSSFGDFKKSCTNGKGRDKR